MAIKKYDLNLMNYMNLFEKVAKIRPKDCFTTSDNMFFFVERGFAKVAIGRQGVNIRQLESALGKKVKVIEYADKPENLVKNYLFAVRPLYVKLANSSLEVKFKFARQRRYLLDNQQARLQELLALVRHCWPDIKDIKVL